MCTKIESDEEKAAYVKARHWDADLAYARDDLNRAWLSAELSLTLAQERANKREIATVRFMIALLQYQNENDQAARPLAEQSMLEFQELQDAYWEARAYDIYGRALTGLGELRHSERVLRKLELTRKAGERNHLADALFIVSIWHYIYNRIDNARKCAEGADLLWKQIGVQINFASMTFALIAWSNGDYDRAKSYYIELEEQFGWQGEKHMRSGMIACLGKIALEQGDLDLAQVYLEQSLAVIREIDYKSTIAIRLVELGNIRYLHGDKNRFKQMVKESISMKRFLSGYAKAILVIALLESNAIQTHTISIQLLGAFHTFELTNERPLRIMYKVFLPDQAIFHARETFGDAAFESAFAKGQIMSLDEALDLALKKVEEI